MWLCFLFCNTKHNVMDNELILHSLVTKYDLLSIHQIYMLKTSRNIIFSLLQEHFHLGRFSFFLKWKHAFYRPKRPLYIIFIKKTPFSYVHSTNTLTYIYIYFFFRLVTFVDICFRIDSMISDRLFMICMICSVAVPSI